MGEQSETTFSYTRIKQISEYILEKLQVSQLSEKEVVAKQEEKATLKPVVPD